MCARNFFSANQRLTRYDANKEGGLFASLCMILFIFASHRLFANTPANILGRTHMIQRYANIETLIYLKLDEKKHHLHCILCIYLHRIACICVVSGVRRKRRSIRTSHFVLSHSKSWAHAQVSHHSKNPTPHMRPCKRATKTLLN